MTAKTLMIQGTGSGVGKSIITAAFCRYFYHEGWRVAPFKAQNMSLNSFVTDEGDEIGRAQAYQAEACGIKPHVTMNPILLKPTSNRQAQVVVMGKVAGSRDAKTYFNGNHQSQYKKHIEKALSHLRNNHELVILEGAGSPAEINLRHCDLVNMDMAEMADAPVLIIGDIDRGGVFAWMKGTYDLLSQKERDRVQGFLINKFRGDLDLLKPGLKQFEDMTGKPILGVIPYCRDLVVDEEDSIPAWNHPAENNSAGNLDVAILWLPRISNFTDVSPLACDPSVSTRYVTRSSQLGDPDLILLPGSKNTLDDMAYLNSQGLSDAVRSCHDKGSIILGLCGGYQMLGTRINDPEHLESECETSDGLGFFDFETTLVDEKITRQIQQTTGPDSILGEGIAVEGYEIHMGRTEFRTQYPCLFGAATMDNSDNLGIIHPGGRILGTYLHGFLDKDRLRNIFLHYVRRQRNLPMPENDFSYEKFREKQLDRLAELVGNAVDMNRIQKMITGKEGQGGIRLKI